MNRRRLGAVMVVLLLAVPQLCAALTPGELNEAGKSAYQRRDFATAARLFGEAVAGAPSEPLFHYHRGAALVRLGQLTEARASYERALALKPPAPLAATIGTALREFGSRPPVARSAEPDPEMIRLEAANGVWLAEVTLNGTRRARFVVDTGATACTISPALAEELGITIPDDAPVIQVVTMNGRTEGRLVALDSLRVGEVEATDVPTVVQPLDPGIDGILGNTFLSRYAVTLDAQRRLLYLRARP
jgi:clan AA aspartic protease (TIGR02281 family)